MMKAVFVVYTGAHEKFKGEGKGIIFCGESNDCK